MDVMEVGCENLTPTELILAVLNVRIHLGITVLVMFHKNCNAVIRNI
jgi:hypothetical protein